MIKRAPLLIVAIIVINAIAMINDTQASEPLQRYFSKHGLTAPGKATILYCHGFGCAFKTRLRYSAGDIARLGGIMAAGRGSPKAERRAISKAVQWFERHAGVVAGTSGDKAKLNAVGGDASQLDCIDESANTTSLLALMAKNGFLRHHRVLTPVTRGFFLDMRYPHNAAVIVEKKSDAKWAVDSWPRANGGRPDIMPLKDWRAIRFN